MTTALPLAAPPMAGKPYAARGFEPCAASVPQSRAWVDEQLATLGVIVEAAELAVSELATNAVKHGDTEFEVRVYYPDSGRVRIDVADQGPGLPEMRIASDEDFGGRGLFLVAQISAYWGFLPEGPGKIVFVILDIGRPHE